MQNFIFDVDGTLIDTFNMYVPTLKQALENHGYAPTQAELMHSFGISGDDALKAMGVTDDHLRQVIFNEWAKLAVKNIDKVTVYPEVEATLTRLAQISQVSLVVATSKTTQDYETGFKTRYQIGALFDAYVTADDTIEHKPNPAPILAGMAKVNAQPNNSVYIGDTVHDLEAAHAAGIKFGAALWGSLQKDQLKTADFLLATPTDLLQLV